MSIQSKVLSSIPGIKHGFGAFSEEVPSELFPEWTSSHPSWKQVHGTAFCEVSDPLQKCGEVDCLLTFTKGIPVAVVTADCVPILFAKRDGSAVVAIHAGWRGTLAGITSHVWERFRLAGEKSFDWVAAIGPAIGPCCYEVSEELIAQFFAAKPALPTSLVSPSFRRLDLAAIHRAELSALGFSFVEDMRICTFCTPGPGFHSFRREKNSDRQYSGLVIL
jgi:YfiH family protein